jgi:peptidoglycan-N-acetylmuramic acid deacetylase
MNPELVKRMVDEGHIVGNHTLTHPDMTKLSDGDFQKELDENDQMYQQIVGTPMPKYYRPPSGRYNEANLRLAKDLGFTTVLWSSAYADWDNNKQPSSEYAITTLMPRLHPGAIVLLHLTSKTNSVILDEYLTRVKKLGYTFKTLDDLKEWGQK